MPRATAFTFGIPVMPRASAGNWARIEQLLDLTLSSVFAQSDADFRVVIACHERPRVWHSDDRVQFLQAEWPADVADIHNHDRGRKAHLINDHVQARGGGLLMFVDADDWVDRTVVATARSAVGPGQVGSLVTMGFAVDFMTRRAAPIPHDEVFPEAFFRICGSSAVLHIQPDSSHPVLADPYPVLHEHHRLPETAAHHGVHLGRLPVLGTYVINTDENHSERFGPFTDWRANFTRAVNRVGRPLGPDLACRFGVERLLPQDS